MVLLLYDLIFTGRFPGWNNIRIPHTHTIGMLSSCCPVAICTTYVLHYNVRPGSHYLYLPM